ncbi:hypothetical protein Tco_1507444 [Tanacetum coccineum]
MVWGTFKLSLKDCPVRDCDVERMSKQSLGILVKIIGSSEVILKLFAGHYNVALVCGTIVATMFGRNGFIGFRLARIRSGVYCPYRGCEGSYLAKGTSWNEVGGGLGKAKTVKVLKVGTEHNAADALTKVVPGRKLQHCLELLKVGVG